MINQNLHKNPIALDRIQHRGLRLNTQHRDMGFVERLNSFFVAGAEFADMCREVPVVFVHAGQDEQGKPAVAPIAVFGLRADDNLCVERGEWRIRYVPAALRTYPFALARVDDQRHVMAFDQAWPGLGTTIGTPLFDAAGEPTELTKQIQATLEAFEEDVDRTRLVGQLLLEKGLLRDMRFDATLPNGETVAVDGFLTVDGERLNALPDEDLVAMQKSGVLGLIHAHQISLGNMNRLAEWHAQRVGAAAPAVAAG